MLFILSKPDAKIFCWKVVMLLHIFLHFDFLQICTLCSKSYYRVFDVTEKTGLRRHNTQRDCDECGTPLKDTIVHFGELSASRYA